MNQSQWYLLRYKSCDDSRA